MSKSLKNGCDLRGKRHRCLAGEGQPDLVAPAHIGVGVAAHPKQVAGTVVTWLGTNENHYVMAVILDQVDSEIAVVEQGELFRSKEYVDRTLLDPDVDRTTRRFCFSISGC